ncbi:hypothetical protein [Cyclobacterium sp. SYSU L10401]|uniref:hypothetical protein n=1 Tax=Cyclobacterium sp. SYSU L10401 TaxID=2678657 RepID=UPI0013D5F9E1|nr:hypothetical protein [Cyclobacterium sp. SYSU L10401]
MERNQRYKDKDDPLSEKLQPKKANQYAGDCYTVGETRTIDFMMTNGTRQNFSYSHYMKAWTEQDSGMQVIKVFFTADLVTIKGYCLETIYDHLCAMDLKSVMAQNPRYHQSQTKDNTPLVTAITIEGHK